MEKEEKITIENLNLGPLPQEQSINSRSMLNQSEDSHYKPQLDSKLKYAKKIFEKGKSALDLKHFKEAIKWFDKALEIDPQYIDAWFLKGEAYENCEDFEKATKCYDAVLKIKK